MLINPISMIFYQWPGDLVGVNYLAVGEPQVVRSSALHRSQSGKGLTAGTGGGALRRYVSSEVADKGHSPRVEARHDDLPLFAISGGSPVYQNFDDDIFFAHVKETAVWALPGQQVELVSTVRIEYRRSEASLDAATVMWVQRLTARVCQLRANAGPGDPDQVVGNVRQRARISADYTRRGSIQLIGNRLNWLETVYPLNTVDSESLPEPSQQTHSLATQWRLPDNQRAIARSNAELSERPESKQVEQSLLGDGPANRKRSPGRATRSLHHQGFALGTVGKGIGDRRSSECFFGNHG